MTGKIISRMYLKCYVDVEPHLIIIMLIVIELFVHINNGNVEISHKFDD
jgi:hypothetical protein